MQINPYVIDKLSELEVARRRRYGGLAEETPGGRKRRVAGPLARASGRGLRRLGARLEAWGTPEARPNVART
jgi:hypothetical protein